MIAGQKSDAVLDYLLRRRSVKADELAAPGPDKAQLQTILTAAARVPDHGKLVPWYFIVFEGEDREKAGKMLREIYAKNNAEVREDKLEAEAKRFLRAPVVIGVISRVRKGKLPIWEQILSAGAACQNLVLAANASGFAAHWVTEWHSFDPEAKRALGLDERDHVAGFIHIGTASAVPEERERPDLNLIVSRYSEARKKGDEYDRDKFDLPHKGFSF